MSACGLIYSLGISLFELFSGRILASPHHVFAVMSARLSRGTAASRFTELGYHLGFEDDAIGSLILDMHLRGVNGRPAIRTVLGRLEWEYSRRFGEELAI